MDLDGRLRMAAFSFLDAIQTKTGGVVRFHDVASFTYEGQRIPLMDPQRGIRKPTLLKAALSFRTVHAPRPDLRPYEDLPGEDGCLRYKWRGVQAGHPENVAMRVALNRALPMIWFQGVASGTYLPIYPVWLIGEEADEHQFIVALDERQLLASKVPDDTQIALVYARRIIQERLHQPLFRLRVLNAYGDRCAMCRLRHPELLDAAHIRPDALGGQPVVPNGIAMCKIHHAAFDSLFLGIRPDYTVDIRRDLMEESDGPTLRYAIQEMDGNRIHIPSQKNARPDQELLAERYRLFKEAS